MKKHDLTPFIIGLIVLFLGFALCFATATWMLTEMLKANSYIKADAIIVDREPHDTWDPDRKIYVTVYYNVIEYEADGEMYRKLTETQNSIFGYDEIGDHYVVYYNPNDPTDVLFKTPDRILMTTVCYLVSGGFAVGEIVVLCKLIKLKKTII